MKAAEVETEKSGAATTGKSAGREVRIEMVVNETKEFNFTVKRIHFSHLSDLHSHNELSSHRTIIHSEQ